MNPDKIFLNQSNQVREGVLSGNQFTFANVSLSEGSNPFEIIFQDKAGNKKSKAFTLTLDTASPVVKIDSLADGDYTNQDTAPVTGTVTDASPITSVMVNGNPVTLQGNSFSTQVTLQENTNTITVTATDQANNPGSASVSVTLDTASPTIEILKPLGDFVNTRTVVVQGQVQDSSAVTLKVNGNDVTLQGNNFETTLQLGEGPAAIFLQASDAALNTSETTIDITIDLTVPQIQILQPGNNTIIKELPINISGNVSDTNLLKVLLNNSIEGPITGNTFTFENMNLEEGVNQLAVKAMDKAGNEAISSISVTYVPDADPPEITLTAPSDGHIGKKSVITVSGTVTDKSPIAYVKVNNSETQLNNGVFSIDLS
ncbi:MAG: hypothetical protein GY940_17740, partial [bacterium]|nr:hypothetical protein [bacterium]